MFRVELKVFLGVGKFLTIYAIVTFFFSRPILLLAKISPK